MKSLKESLFDKDLVQKGVPINIDAAYDYISNIITRTDFKPVNRYDSLKRSYEIERGEKSFSVILHGYISYSDTDKSHMRGLDRMIDYGFKIHFDQYESGAVINYVEVNFCQSSQLESEGYGEIPKEKNNKQCLLLTTENIGEIFNNYIKQFSKIEQYFSSQEFKDIVSSGQLDVPNWGFSKTLYNRRLKKYNECKKQVLKNLKKYVKNL